MTDSGSPYTTRLQAGHGLIQETRILLERWRPGESAPALYQSALSSGAFPGVTARRLRNVIVECFAPRYLVNDGAPARHLQLLVPKLPAAQLAQLMLIFTARANRILGDFVRQVFWPKYAGGISRLTSDDAHGFVQRALDDGKMSKRWSEATVRRVSGDLLGVCADYGLLRRVTRTGLDIVPVRIADAVATYLAYDLHFGGRGDFGVLNHEDWRLFGLTPEEVLDELRRVGQRGHLIVQAGGGIARLSWKYTDMEELCCELS